MQSLITGKLLIEIDFFPGTPVNLKNINKSYTEIPTIPSTASKIGRALDKLDLEAVQKKLESALDGIAKLTNNPDLAASIGHLKETLRDARELVNRVDRQVDPLAKDTKKTVNDIGRLAIISTAEWEGSLPVRIKPCRRPEASFPKTHR